MPLRVSQALKRGDEPRRVVRVSARSTRSREILALDALWRELIYLRDQKTCQIPLCGKRDRGIQAHHIFTKQGKFLTRWDEDNGICLCKYHHHWFAHVHPVRFDQFIQKRLPPEQYARLVRRHNLSAKGQDLGAVRLYLLQRIAELKALREARDVAEG